MNTEEIEVRIEGMHCISCASSIEKAVRKVPGVQKVVVDYPLNAANILATVGTPHHAIVHAIVKAGYYAEVVDTRKVASLAPVIPLYNQPLFINFLTSFLFTLPLLINMVAVFYQPELLVVPWAQLILATVVQFWCGRSLYWGALASIRALSPNMDVLIVLGSLASYILSLALMSLGHRDLYFETGAFIITVVLFGRWIEGGAKEKSRQALVKLIALRPKKVKVERGGQLLEIDPQEVQVNDLFWVGPGEVIAVDGLIVEGTAMVNQEAIFGESVPVKRGQGERIFAGTLNVEGTIRARSDKVGSDTILEHVIERAKKLHTTKAPLQRTADLVAEVFVPAIIATGCAVFFAWWYDTRSAMEAALPAISTIVIACPCAIGMATPIALLVASTLSARCGLVFHDARAIEVASKIKILAFDKTGTITEGEPQVQKVFTYNHLSESEALCILASIEALSSHPIAQAIVHYARKLKILIEPVVHVQSLIGKGIQAEKRGELYFAGSLAYAQEQGIAIPPELGKEEEALSVVLVHGGKIVAGLSLQDVVRPYTEEVIEKLRGKGIRSVLITGDKKEIANAIAGKVGIPIVFSEVLPDKKVDIVQELKEEYEVVGMCGDGINDAFALAAADVGFSMASGSDFAIESSDITLMNQDLRGLINAIDLSRSTLRKIKQNLFLAAIYNIVAIPLAASGLLNPMIAATAMVASSLSVVLNAQFLRSWKPPYSKL